MSPKVREGGGSLDLAWYAGVTPSLIEFAMVTLKAGHFIWDLKTEGVDAKNLVNKKGDYFSDQCAFFHKVFFCAYPTRRACNKVRSRKFIAMRKTSNPTR